MSDNIPQNMVKPHQNYACLCWNTARWQLLPMPNAISGMFFMFADSFYSGGRKVYIIREHEVNGHWFGRYIATTRIDRGEELSPEHFAFIEAQANTFDDLRGGVSYFAGVLE